jgi:hypothetical protein
MAIHALLTHRTAGTATDTTDQHPIALFEPPDGITSLFDNAHALMPDRRSIQRRRYMALQDMQIGATDGGVDDLQDRVGRLLNLGLRLVFERDLVAAAYEGFHLSEGIKMLLIGCNGRNDCGETIRKSRNVLVVLCGGGF